MFVASVYQCASVLIPAGKVCLAAVHTADTSTYSAHTQALNLKPLSLRVIFLVIRLASPSSLNFGVSCSFCLIMLREKYLNSFKVNSLFFSVIHTQADR